MGFDSEESLLKRAMIEVSGEAVVVVTSDKLGAAATHQVARITDVQHLVVEHEVSPQLRAAFTDKGVNVLRAEPIGD